MQRDMKARILTFIIGILLTALGLALIAKSAIGQSAVSGLAANLAFLGQYKTGTALLALNILFFATEVMILRRRFKALQLLQLPASLGFSVLVNFFLYDIPLVAKLASSNYPIQFMILLVGVVVMALGISLFMEAKLVYMPYEGLNHVLHEEFDVPFGTARRYFDLGLVLISLLLILFFKIPNTTVREGTLILAVLMGTLTNFFMKRLNPGK